MCMQKRRLPERFNNARIGHALAINRNKSVRCDRLKHALFLHHMQDGVLATVGTNIAYITIHTAAISRNDVQHISNCRRVCCRSFCRCGGQHSRAVTH